jgi:hypothetical protein
MAADPFLDPAAILQWSETVGIQGFMTSRYGWPTVEILHFTGLCLLFASVAMFDLRMLGVARGVGLRDLHRLVPFGVAGFLLSVSTGFLFVVATPDQYLYNPAVQTKLGLIGVAGANMLAFYATTASAVARTPSQGLPPFRARVFAGVSLACWIGVICCGRVVTMFRPPERWCFWCV